MDTDALIGWIAIAAALVLLTYLVLWGRRTINRIARTGGRSAREIHRELHGGG
ncbi:MAG TPA: hypothetical protein VM695_12290 [Phycisphaerae bacterium]|nr:hypothetical protein [Phycisphaerae bacterium]